jgi:hypothetical protein
MASTVEGSGVRSRWLVDETVQRNRWLVGGPCVKKRRLVEGILMRPFCNTSEEPKI